MSTGGRFTALLRLPQVLPVLGFLLVILVGSLLLSLPFAHRSGGLSYLDALFTSASAVCVTGLATVSKAGLASDVLTYPVPAVGQKPLKANLADGGTNCQSLDHCLFACSQQPSANYWADPGDARLRQQSRPASSPIKYDTTT